jgi:hypothetical protein
MHAGPQMLPSLDGHDGPWKHAGPRMRSCRSRDRVGGAARSHTIRLDYHRRATTAPWASESLILRRQPAYYQVSLEPSQLAKLLT